MKSKDIVALIIAVVIFLVAGYLVSTQVLPQKSAQQEGVKVEVVGEIGEDFDSVALELLANPAKVRDFSVPIDLTSGLDNQAVFGR